MPDAHSTSDIIAPRYLRIFAVYHFRLEANGATAATAAMAMSARRVLTGTVDPIGT